eukprot:gene14989-28313_t
MTEIGGLGYLGAVPGKSAGFKGIATATNLLQVKAHWHPTAAHAVLHVKALTLANPLPFHFSGLAPPDTLTTLTAHAKLQKIQTKTISRLVQKAHGSKLEPGSVAYNKVAEKVASTFLDHTAGDEVSAKFSFATMDLVEKVL